MLSRSFGRKMLQNVQSSNSNALRSKAIFRKNTLNCHYSSILSPLVDLLRPNHSDIITEEQNLLTSLLSCLRSIDASKEEIDLIYDTRSRMSDLFLIVIVGEFNSGKSTLINGLIGVNLLESGVLPTTNKICIVRHESQQNIEGTAWKQADNMILGDVQEVKINIPWLKNIAIVDTPGTNAIVSDHEHLTQQIIPRADLVLFVTSAERPMSDSESAVLSKIKQWGRKVVMIVNKLDILQEPSDQEKVLNFVTQHAAQILGDTVSQLPIYGVSGRLALNAKILNSGKNKNNLGASSWEDSKFGALEKYLMSVLGQEQLIKSKLKNPLGVADRIISDSIANLESRQHVLEGDFRVLEMIEDNMIAYKSDMEREIKLFRINIKTLLQQVSDRCDKYLERKISILNSSFLLDTKSFQEEFSREVLMDLNQPIDDILVDMCNLITKKSKVQARSVVDFVGNRPKKHRDSIVGSVNFVTPEDTQFDASKYELIERIRRNIKLLLTTHDQSKNVVKISSEVRSSLLHTAAVQGVSVASIGAVTSSNVIGVGLSGLVGGPGLFLAGAAGSMVLGMYILPRKKEIIKADFSSKMLTLQSQIDTVVLNDIQREIQSNDNRIHDSIAPYSRFIEIEKKKVSSALETLNALKKTTREIQSKLK